MNDLQKLTNLFDELGVPYTKETSIDLNEERIATDEYDGAIDWDVRIKIERGIGFYDFYCCFYFLDGNFKGHGLWE